MTDPLLFAAHLLQVSRRPLTPRQRAAFDREVLKEDVAPETLGVRQNSAWNARERLRGLIGLRY